MDSMSDITHAAAESNEHVECIDLLLVAFIQTVLIWCCRNGCTGQRLERRWFHSCVSSSRYALHINASANTEIIHYGQHTICRTRALCAGI